MIQKGQKIFASHAAYKFTFNCNFHLINYMVYPSSVISKVDANLECVLRIFLIERIHVV